MHHHLGSSITSGLIISLAQSFISVLSMKWAWRKPFFYWVWGGGFFFRLLVFSATAYVVHVHTTLHLAATLVSLVTSTTLLMVVESHYLLGK